ncbi:MULTISPECIES: hypothetical protein [unclassified Streptomyces]|uniref:hypothetical protein n=1 Tax=unclassified Streptomyces TaxID=2593676 RepID=UPI00225A8368|nr:MULTISPECIES: hypothetical protein [unclassified Streptomyces]MCX5438881.1 hypothetical protein [Streptomyces sp. NBC_00063]WSE16464.1 hypothetical protein OG518_25780 [Streptomyces sp. NBC_01397]WUB94618.1 hypothetical protein OHO83_21135 [Streptomyces sp. NBC_00569]
MPPVPPDPLEVLEREADERRREEEKRGERHMWWYLAYFLFGIHLVALVMIYAVTHAK